LLFVFSIFAFGNGIKRFLVLCLNVCAVIPFNIRIYRLSAQFASMPAPKPFK
jgi:hypothetical protein